MNINEILKEKNMTKYRLAKLSGVPNATLSELCSGKTSIEKCSGETLYRISKALGVSMESLVKEAVLQKEVEKILKRHTSVRCRKTEAAVCCDNDIISAG